jgi:hypothetical protein
MVSPDGEAKFWLEPTVSLATYDGLQPSQLKRLQAIVEERRKAGTPLQCLLAITERRGRGAQSGGEDPRIAFPTEGECPRFGLSWTTPGGARGSLRGGLPLRCLSEGR